MHRSLTSLIALSTALAAVVPASAQSIFICHFSQNGGPNLAAFDAQDGRLLSASVLDITIASTTLRPVQPILFQDEWWITDDAREVAHVFGPHGVEFRRDEFGANGDIAGATVAGGSAWFAAQEAPFVPGNLIEVRANGTRALHPLTIDSPEGIGLFNGELIVTYGGGAVRVDPATGAELGDLYSSLSQQGALQPVVRGTTGNLLVARAATHSDVIELDATGAIVAEYDIGAAFGIFAPFACFELGSGDFLVSSESGVHVFDPAMTSATPVLDGVRCRMGFVAPELTIGSSYCGPAVLNSTGRPGVIAASGSTLAADGALRLAVHDLPQLSSGYFLVSQTQGFAAGPGGSSGNLCLGGAIGRHLMQVQSTSSVGFFDITVDTNAIPQPTGTLPLLAGSTWNWQAWYRDAIGGQATSNFTDAVSVSFN